MKKIYSKHIASSLLAMFLFVGCDDAGFLKEDPETFYTIDNVFSTSEQVAQVITTCYHRVRNIYCPYNNSSELNVWSYSMGNGTDIFDVPTIRFSYRFNDYSIINSENAVFKDTYAAFYYLINSANTALYAADREDIVWNSEAERVYIIAQARFFRAFAYRNLGELFGGVPLVTERTTTPRYDYARSTRMETYQYAIDEMEAILNDLPVTTADAGRLVKAAAQHNLCQLYMDKGVLLEAEGGDAATAYNKAISYANDVIDSGTYSLMTERFGSRKDENPEFYYASSVADQTPDHTYTSAGYPIEGNLYWDLFQIGNQDYQDGNKEAIWCAQSDYEVYKSDGNKACLDYPGIYGPVFRDQGAAHITGDREDVGGFGMCQITPTPYARDQIYADKWGDDLRNSEAVLHRTFLGNVKTSEYYGKKIPWDVLYRMDGSGKPADAAYTMLYPLSCKIGPDFYTLAADGRTLRSIFRDDYLIRLPETILLRAEAKMRVGNNAGAASDINMLRSRAKCSYLVTASDVSIDLILDERARELIYEESRWNTLLRMGGTVAIDRIKKYSYWDYPRTTLNKAFSVWPIPQSVIDTNKDVDLEQNQGW
ncbi:RagB/SusD family nutrient uptake outer membrane protein [Parabacteroides faecis]|uniref:RagB/SusD family nutrient uptake outer membrane protein n=1 Tax=Parabacteroides faecis TaxID=1217282 RepID=UPI0021649E31|nr:RagB/SusD family nutrient uptake outer membrane protein [Parabacteroides faecis]MCS2892466.1 RagB/SusD family nutrient uptake outer membrane protein [Parabacteroides faecis]UVQ48896.1 RagB/SusD family nutrient uptake outer membrane protein [Parabacteroides faecis]